MSINYQFINYRPLVVCWRNG